VPVPALAALPTATGRAATAVVAATYTYVMATTAAAFDLRYPTRAAAAVDGLNDRLAAGPAVDDAARDGVAALTDAVRETPLDRWIAADPYLALLVHRSVLEAQAAAQARERDALRLALERAGHALAALGEAEEVGDGRPAKELARWLAETVDAPQRDLANLLGVDLRRFQRWASAAERTRPEGEDARRVRAVARLVAQLRHAYTAAGVLAWFERPRADLGGHAPRELLDDPVRLPDLLLAAGSARATTFA
jgi:hypothetical protein